MVDTLWTGQGDDKLYLQSGQFTSTIKTSQSVGAVDINPHDISWDGTNTPWIGIQAQKLYLQSGQFTSTLKTSQAIGAVDTGGAGISWDGTDTPWSGATDDKLYLTSGQFTSTIKTSQSIGAVETTIHAISWDGTNTPWSGITDDKLYLQSGQFTSTLKTSQSTTAASTDPRGITFNGTDTPWLGGGDDKLFLTSGQFTSTIKTSESLTAIDASPEGIETSDVDARLNESTKGTATFSATATIVVAARMRYRSPTAAPVGTAEISANLALEGNTATIQGTATVVANGQAIRLISSTLSATAEVIASGRFQHSPAVVIQARATIANLPTVHIRSGADVNAQANITAYAEHYRPVVNPTLSGDLVDFATKLRFKVNGNTVNLVDTPYYALGDLRVGYDGKWLTFSEIATPTMGHPTWKPEQSVQMEIDFGSGFQTYFKGKIKSREHIGENNNEQIRYEATGYQVLANDVTLLNTDDRPEVLFTVMTTPVQVLRTVATSFNSNGQVVTTASTVSTATTSYTKKVAEAIQDIFTLAASALGAAGIPATIGNPGLERFQASLPERIQLRNTGFFAALSALAAHEPGIKPFFDDVTQTWIFPNLLEQITAQVNVSSVNLLNANFTQDTNDRYTAVRLYAEPTTAPNTIDIGGNRGYISPRIITLQADWDANLEPQWDIYSGAAGPGNGVPEDEFYWVFRRYRIPEGVTGREPGTSRRVRQRIDVEQMTIDSSGNAATEIIRSRWSPIEAYINFNRRLVITNFPVFNDGNPYEKGSCTAARELQLSYWPLGVWNFTYPTSLNSDGSIATTASTLTRDGYLSAIRFPETGYCGSAYDLYGIEREYVEMVNYTEVTSANAEAKLLGLKDVRVTGDLPIEGDPLELGINLQAKLRLTHATQATGLNSFGALLTGFRYEFGKRGKNTLSLSTDTAALVKL